MAGKQTKPRNLTGKRLGRPPKVFTGENLERIYKMAHNGCHNNTIAKVVGCDVHTLEKYLSKKIQKKRAEGKEELRSYQRTLSKTYPAMAIFRGKNELGQTDRQDIVTSTDQVRALSQAQEAATDEYLEWWRTKVKLAK